MNGFAVGWELSSLALYIVVNLDYWLPMKKAT